MRRKDAQEVKDIASFKRMFPYLMRGRNESAVYFHEEIEMGEVIKFLKQKNAGLPKKRYGIFHVFLAAMVRTFTLRPQMNRFIINRKFYQRNNIIFSFIVKRQMTDDGDERTAIITFDTNDTLDTVADRVDANIDRARNDDSHEDEDLIKTVLKFPKFIVGGFIALLRYLDRIGMMPKEIADIDSMHVSAYIANLGSIGLDKIPFHHLYEWGTTSVFIVMGKLHKVKYIGDSGEEQVKDVMDITVTIDERIADGVYFSRTIEAFKRLMQNPQELESPPVLESKLSTPESKLSGTESKLSSREQLSGREQPSA